MNRVNFQPLYQEQARLGQHRVFSLIRSPQDLATFMSWHVFAVWDFMSLTKRLQADLTTISTPWLPPKNPMAARLINEIVLAEESDELPDGSHASHFDMYLLAMQEVGADTQVINEFIDAVRSGMSVKNALRQADLPPALVDFVMHTMTTVREGSLSRVLGNFFFGREGVIPDMFQGLLDQWGMDESKAPLFVYYLNRHIELDGDSHGPAALRLIDMVIGSNKRAANAVVAGAEQAIAMRAKLWDALADALELQHSERYAKAS